MSATPNILEQYIRPAGAGKGVDPQATALARARYDQEVSIVNTPALTTPAHTYHQHPNRGRARQVGRFLLHFLEMQIPMVLGMAVFGMLARQLHSGTDLYIIGDGLFMSVPMVAWMVWRGHDWQHSLEMGASMLVPGLAIIALGWLGADSYAPWLREGACGFMCLGMPVYMLWRRDHFTAKAAPAPWANV